MTDGRPRAGVVVAILAVYLVSGAAALVYEVLWTRALGLVLGTTAVALSLVLAAFMGGLALGSAAAGRLAERLARPLVAYGILEIATGLFALLVPALARNEAVASTVARAPVLGATFAFALLLVPTAAMGATFPLLCRQLASLRGGAALAYGVNAAGAVAGTLAAAYVLLPAFGLTNANAVAAGAGVLAGAAGIALGLRAPAPLLGDPSPAPLPSPAPVPAPTPEPDPPAISTRAALLTALLSGLAGLLLEVGFARVLGLLLGSSVYAVAVMLATFLAGIAVGSLAAGPIAARLGASGVRAACAAASLLTAVAAFASLFLVRELPYVFLRLYARLGSLPLLEAALAAAVLLAPALGLGATFAALLAARGGAPRAAARLYAVDTVGAIAGALAGGLVLVPAIGVQATLLAGIVASVLAAACALGRPWAFAAATVLAAGAVVARPPWDPSILATGAHQYAAEVPQDLTRAQFFEQFEPGRIELLFARDGRTSTVTVERFPLANTIYLKNNGKVEGSAPIDPARPSAADMMTQVLLAKAPLAIHGAAREVLVIGLGSGVTAGAAVAFPEARVRVVEIEAEVVEAVRRGFFDDANDRVLSNPRVAVDVDDARRWLLARPERRQFDVIVSQPAEPWLTGVANLFTQEFFELGARALRRGGLFCQWVQLYGLDEPSFRTLVATFHSVFPQALVLRPRGSREVLLLGAETAFSLGLSADDEEVLGAIVAGPADVAAFAAGAPLNTDDRPLVELRAPRTRYAPKERATELLRALAGRPTGLCGLVRRDLKVAWGDEAGSALALDAVKLSAVLAEAAEKSGNLWAAEAWLRCLGDGPDVHRRLARLFERRGDLQRAVLEWNEVIAREPGDREALRALLRLRERLGGGGR